MTTAVTHIPGDLRAVLFDVDGTLVDSTAAHALCWHEALRAYGHTVPTAQTHRAIGMGSQRLLDSVLDDADGAADAADAADADRSHDDEIIEAHRVLYRLFWERLAPLPGAVDLLRACHETGRRVVLASSAAADELAMLRRVLDADHLIDAATDSSDVEATKPASDLVEVALSRAGVRAEQALFVGDAVWDGLAAGGAGVAFVGVACGAANADELRKVGAVEVVATPGELVRFLPPARRSSPA
jgi:HAD superfamily hydrolase (TIGR01509 family)